MINSYKRLKLEYEGIKTVLSEYTSNGNVRNFLNGLGKALDQNMYDEVLYYVGELVSWYNTNITSIDSNDYVYNKDTHHRNKRLIEDIYSDLQEKNNHIQLTDKPFYTKEKGDSTLTNERFKIFIVHGHDGALREKVARLVEKQNLEAIILSEQANQGATIIEKIEKNSDVKAAICLFTADDKCQSNNTITNRARQNVVFEAGYFIGKLGRENVILVAGDSVEMPSDLSGVVYSSNDGFEIEVLKDLKKMGFNIDMNKAF